MTENSANVPRLVSAAALIGGDGRMLLQKRPADKALPGLWEFPGGKVEPGETPEQALIRELTEELGIRVELTDLSPLVFASEPVAGRHLILLLYVVHRWRGEPTPLEAPEIGWYALGEMAGLAMPPADEPFLPALGRYLGR